MGSLVPPLPRSLPPFLRPSRLLAQVSGLSEDDVVVNLSAFSLGLAEGRVLTQGYHGKFVSGP